MDTLNQKISSCELVSGEEARKYRKRIAAAASTGRGDAQQTIKFKLEKKDSLQLPPFDAFRSLYDTLEGVEKGTLTYLLFTLIVSGFRLFPSAKEAITYQNRSKFHSAKFLKTAQKLFAEPLPKFTPERIVNRIGQPISRKSIADGRPAKEILFSVYKKDWALKSTDAEFDQVLTDIAEKLGAQFPDVREIAKDKEEALKTVDSVLMPRGFPSLARMAKCITDGLPKNSSIVFDCALPFTHPDAVLNPYIAVAALLQTYDWESSETAKEHVKERLTTMSNNALSWLFNKGIKLFKERPLAESADGEPSLSELYSVPKDRLDSLRYVKEAAEAIPEEDLLLSPFGLIMSYRYFRSRFGGNIDCWVSNYINRLIELRGLLKALPDELTIPNVFINEAGEDFLQFAGLQRAEVEAAVSSLERLKPQAACALDKLCGISKDLPDTGDIESIKMLTVSVNRLAAVYRALSNSITQAVKDVDGKWINLAQQMPGDWKIWESLQPLPKLNSLSGGLPDEQNNLNSLASDYTAVMKLRTESLERVLAWAKANGAYSSVIEAVETKERTAVAKRGAEGNDPEAFIKEQTARKILSLIARTFDKSNDRVSEEGRRWFKDQNIFRNPKDFNRFFFNHQGCLYRTVFSSSRHQPFEITEECVSNIQTVWDRFKDFFAEEDRKTELFSEESCTLLRIQNLIDLMELSAVTTRIPQTVARITLPENCKSSLSEEAVLGLREQSVDPHFFIYAFNTYNRLLSCFVTRLRRERFFLRASFLWIDNHTLTYVPKEKLWNIPNTYLKDPDFAEVVNSEDVVKVGTQIDTAATFTQLAGNKTGLTRKLCKFLAQMPHDWSYLAPFKNANEKAEPVPCDVLLIRKGDSAWGKADANRLMRLIGPSSYKTRLDRLMLEPEKFSLGEMTLLVDQSVGQRIDENTSVHLEYEDPILSVALPINEVLDKENSEFPFRRIVAIDQGEIGIAYAVFDLSDAGKADAAPIATGTVPLPSIRRLIKNVKNFQSVKQSSGKFNQRFDSTMFTIRENVAGDVTHAIVGLMKRFNAIPVLENQVGQFESKSKQIQLIYKAVNARFLYSGIDNHANIRRNLWFNGERFVVPGYKILKNEYAEEINERGEKTKKKTSAVRWENFTVFPGYGVSSQFTSQICSHCRRNIGEILNRAKNDETFKEVQIDEDGGVNLFGEKIRLYKPAPEKRQMYLRRNERNPLTIPFGKATMKFSDFRRLVKANLRRPAQSLQSKDTTQSRFHCVFADCANHNQGVHADINAAVNIGRRLLERLKRV